MFDPYHKWLGIPPHKQPANHYDLLGIELFENDLDVIRNAADQRMMHVKSFTTSAYGHLSQQILNEVAAAKICLVNRETKVRYDAELGEQAEALPSATPKTDFPRIVTSVAQPQTPKSAHTNRERRLQRKLVICSLAGSIVLLAAMSIWWSQGRVVNHRRDQSIPPPSDLPQIPSEPDVSPVDPPQVAAAQPESEAKPESNSATSTAASEAVENTPPAPVAQRRNLYGQGGYNPQTGFLKLTYDFDDSQQLSDFEFDSRIGLQNGSLVIPANLETLHRVPFVSLRVIAKVEVAGDGGPWLQTTSGILGGNSGHNLSLWFDPEWRLVKGPVDDAVSSKQAFELSNDVFDVDMMVEPDLSAVEAGPASVSLEAQSSDAGQVRLLGASAGVAFLRLSLEGFVDATAFERNFDSDKLATPDVRPRPPLMQVRQVKENRTFVPSPRESKDAAHDLFERVSAAMTLDSGSTRQWIAMENALEIAKDAEDIESMMAIADIVESHFSVAASKMKTRMLISFMESRPPSWRPEDPGAVLRVMDEAVNDDNYEAAESIYRLLYDRVPASENLRRPYRTLYYDKKKEIQEAKQEWSEFRKSQVTLASEGNSNALDLQAAVRYCFMKKNWKKGMPLLAEADYPELSLGAEQDVALQNRIASSDELLHCADEWWQLGDKVEVSGIDKSDSRAACRRRAAYWYRRALPGCSATAKTYVRRRLRSYDIVGPYVSIRGIKRRFRLRDQGGDERTEDAVRRGLSWLERNQRSGGMWSLKGPYADGSQDPNENFAAATSLALLALLRDGRSHSADIARGVRGLIDLQQPDGSFPAEPNNVKPYTHALATLVMCHVTGFSRDDAPLDAAERAIAFAMRNQNKDGGWGYDNRSDTSVTTWFLRALHAAKQRNIAKGAYDIQATIDESVAYLNSVQAGNQYRYRPQDPPKDSITASAIMCRLYQGWDPDEAHIQAATRHLAVLAEFPPPAIFRFSQYHHATQAAFNVGGEHWSVWNEKLKRELLRIQESRGSEEGSWNPELNESRQGGRLFGTCLAIYALQTYYASASVQ